MYMVQIYTVQRLDHHHWREFSATRVTFITVDLQDFYRRSSNWLMCNHNFISGTLQKDVVWTDGVNFWIQGESLETFLPALLIDVRCLSGYRLSLTTHFAMFPFMLSSITSSFLFSLFRLELLLGSLLGVLLFFSCFFSFVASTMAIVLGFMVCFCHFFLFYGVFALELLKTYGWTVGSCSCIVLFAYKSTAHHTTNKSSTSEL